MAVLDLATLGLIITLTWVAMHLEIKKNKVLDQVLMNKFLRTMMMTISIILEAATPNSMVEVEKMTSLLIKMFLEDLTKMLKGKRK